MGTADKRKVTGKVVTEKIIEKVDKTTKVVSANAPKDFNKLGRIRSFDGVDYELKSTEILNLFGKTYRDGFWMETKVKNPKILNTRCNITNVADVDITSIDTECLYK